jgi:hypothetical protein
MVPNNVVLSAAVLPIREPEPVDVRVRLETGISITQVQSILDDQIQTPTRRAPVVLLEQIDGADVVVRVQATPDRANDGAKLADEVIQALSTVTGEHPVVDEHGGASSDAEGGTPSHGDGGTSSPGDGWDPAASRDPATAGDPDAQRDAAAARRR